MAVSPSGFPTVGPGEGRGGGGPGREGPLGEQAHPIVLTATRKHYASEHQGQGMGVKIRKTEDLVPYAANVTRTESNYRLLSGEHSDPQLHKFSVPYAYSTAPQTIYTSKAF